jgi:HK97 family phage major capsid protein
MKLEREALAAKHAAAEKQRELRELTARRATEEMLASEAREVDKSIRESERELSRLEREAERLEGLVAGRQLIPVLDPATPAPSGWRATARGELYSERTYRPDQGPSFFRDVIAARDDPSAQERLLVNQREGIGDLGIRADVTSGDPGLTGLVPPLYLQDQWAAFPRPTRPFADAIGSYPLADVGMTVSVPRVTTGTLTGVQAAELDAVTEQDPDTDSLTAPVVTIAGQVDISRQSLERSMPHADFVLFSDLIADYDMQLDRQLISGLGSAGQHRGILNMSPLTVTYNPGTPSASEALRAIFDGIQKVASTRFQPAEAIMLHPRRGADLASSLSPDMPLFPLGSTAARALGTSNAGFTDDLAGLRTILDANLPTTHGSGTNQDLIAVLRLSDLLLFEQPVRQLRFEALGSGNLMIRLQVYSYSAFIPHRWPSSVCLVTGSGLANPWS